MGAEYIFDLEQGSPSWLAARLGRPTASRFEDVLAKGKGMTRRKYMLTLVGERLSGEPEETYSNGFMERGKLLEETARNAYALMRDADPKLVGFVKNGEVGASPDSLLGDVGLLEIKTKLPRLHIECLLEDELPSDHIPQVQGQLWVAEREWCDFVSFPSAGFPRIPLFVKRVYRDELYIVNLKREVDKFLGEMVELQASIENYQPKAGA